MKKKLAFGMLLMLLGLTACGKKAQITIDDGGVKTSVEVSVPEKVEKILETADIKLGEKDSTDPAPDTEVQDATEIRVLRMNHVKIKIDGKEEEVDYLGGTVKDLLADRKISLTDAQTMNVKESDPLKDGMEIVIESSYGVKIVCDGKTQSVTATNGTVQEVLTGNSIELGADDEVTPSKDTHVTEGMEIVVKRVSYKEEKETVEIDFETKKEDDSSLEKGTEKVKTEGVKGEKTVESRIKLVDGKEESREVIKEEITKEPVDEIILVGTKEKPAGKQVVSKVAVPNCADGSHGYYEIHYSDGSVEYVEY